MQTLLLFPGLPFLFEQQSKQKILLPFRSLFPFTTITLSMLLAFFLPACYDANGDEYDNI